MLVKPKYAMNIIVGVIYKDSFKWYITDKELWFLDLRKLIRAYEAKGLKIPNKEDFSERYDIDILNKENASIFLEFIEDYQVSTYELNNLLIEKQYDNIAEIVPSLFVDFDREILKSNYPEPASYEYFVPDEWMGKYEGFMNQIPLEERYWMKENINLFSEVK